MLSLRWGLLGVALLVALTHGASIHSADNDDNTDDVKYIEDVERSKRSYKRGQTQSQYLNFGQPEQDGKAEAEATEGGSRSSVSGTHGMGQAQSQFSSGDCSGCGVGSPPYEYSTGSPDPLTLGGNLIPYSDGKPSSIIGLHGSTPSGTFGPAGSFSGSSGGLPRAGGTLSPDAGSSSGQLGQPGVTGGFDQGNVVRGQPGMHGTLIPVAGSVRPDGGYAPGGSYIPSSGGAAILRGPGADVVYAPGKAYAPSTDNSGQVGRLSPDGSQVPGSTYITAARRPGQTGRPDGVYAPDSAYFPSTATTGQVGRHSPDGSYAPGSTYISDARGPGQTAIPGSDGTHAPGGGSGQLERARTGGDFSPGSAYPHGNGDLGQIGRPDATGTYSPGTSGGDTYAPGGVYASGGSGRGQEGIPGPSGKYYPGTSGGGTFPPGSVYTPGRTGTGQIEIPGARDTYSPSSSGSGGYVPSGVYAPGGSGGGGQRGAPGTLFGQTYGPEGNRDVIGQPGASGHGHAYGHAFPPGTSQQQLPQYLSGRQALPSYGTEVRRPAGDQQIPSYGQTEQQLPGIQTMQPGSYYGPSTRFAPDQQQVPQHGTDSQTTGYLQQPGFAPSSGGTTPGGSGSLSGTAARPGEQYPATTPQQILPQPGATKITRPTVGVVQQGIGGPGQQTGIGFQSGFQKQPSASYGQPGVGMQSGAGFGHSEAAQQGRRPDDGGLVQPGGTPTGTGVVQRGPGDQYGRAQPSEGFIQPGGANIAGGFIQPGAVSSRQNVLQPVGFGQPGRQAGVGIQPESIYGQQPGTTHFQPGIGIQHRTGIPHGQQGLLAQPGFMYPGATFNQEEAGYPPGSVSFGGKSGTIPQQTPSGPQQLPGFSSALGPQEPGPIYGQAVQGGMSPSGGFVKPTADTQPGIGGFGQQIVGHLGRGPQVGAQPGAGYAPLPGGSVQGGEGAGYDRTYGQQPGAQPGASYGQVTGGGLRQPGVTGVYLPGAGPQATYGQPSGTGLTQYSQGPQQILQPGSTYIPGSVQPSGMQQSIAGSGDVATGAGGFEDAFSQAESSIGSGQASASAQGKKNGGTAKTQVQGTYSSSGSFSASAMTADNDRSASSQVTGGVEGAMSQSQGQGGAAQSQAQVQLNEKTGGTKASSQSGGIIHQSQSEVQANDKGGLADAQSSGPGQTSSQAQIGFRPGQDDEVVRSAGGGQASAQSGVHYGNSQSQIQGTSKYGVSYHGAAQSASGTKEQVASYREQNRDIFNTISQFGGTDAVTDRVDTVYNPSLTSESDIPDLQLKASRTNKEVLNTNKLADDSVLPDEEEEEEPYDEYEDEEDYYNENPIKMESKINSDKKLGSSSLYRTHIQTSPTQTQQVAVADPNKKYSLVQNQNGRVQTYPPRTTTETLPNGFRGTVNVEKKFHTKSLETHKIENKVNITADEKSGDNPRTPDSFVTVTKSITGSMDNSKNPPQDNKNFQSTYYTKSSTCGYFTFSCNIVYGANGRSKICRPKAPANGKC